MIPNIIEVLEHYPEFDGVHEACMAVPMVSEEDFAEIVSDIAEHGLREPLLRSKDRQLLDGRTRLLACYECQQDIRIKDDSGIVDPWRLVNTLNMKRRHCTFNERVVFAAAMLDHFEAEAKKRQGTRNDIKDGRPECSNAGQSRDQAAAEVGVSGRVVGRYKTVKEERPDLAKKIAANEMTVDQGYKLAQEKRKGMNSKPVGKPPKQTEETVSIITVDGKTKTISKPKTVRFNRTNDSVDWASWTWNPVTGCNHGCNFCYAREIAHSQRMADYYPNQFTPTFHEYRLDAPSNTPIPEEGEDRDKRVFVCSMADLFGKWVPDKWIARVFEACIESPEWEYLFLTKWPARYKKMPLMENAWYGSSVVKQSDVSRVEKAMSGFNSSGSIKWVSMEPMLEPIEFSDLSWCDLMVIGAQTQTTQPEGYVEAFSPEFDWVVDVVNQCREAGVPYYLKANLGPEKPGMKLPKNAPRCV